MSSNGGGKQPSYYQKQEIVPLITQATSIHDTSVNSSSSSYKPSNPSSSSSSSPASSSSPVTGFRVFFTKQGWIDFREEMKKPQSIVLGLLLLGLALTGALQNVFLTLMANSLRDFPYTLLIFPILANAAFFFPIVWVKQYRGLLPPETTNLKSKWKIFLMGIFDQLADFLVIYGSTAIVNPVFINMYTQLNIPSTMVFSFIFLKARYRLPHYAGALIVIFAIGLTVYGAATSPVPPSSSSSSGSSDSSSSSSSSSASSNSTLLYSISSYFLASNSSSSGSASTGSASEATEGGPSLLYGNLLFIAQCIPAGLAAVIKEWSLGGHAIDIYYINAWESLFQVILGVIMIPLVVVIPDPASPFSIPSFRDVPGYFLNSWNCLITQLPVEEYPFCTQPAPAWSMILLFVLFDIAFNIFLLLIVKKGSATVMWLGIALSIPVTEVTVLILSKTTDFFSGTPDQTPLSFLIPSIFLILIGMFVYRLIPDTELASGKAAQVPMALAVYFTQEEEEAPQIAPKSPRTLRRGYFGRLGITGREPTSFGMGAVPPSLYSNQREGREPLL